LLQLTCFDVPGLFTRFSTCWLVVVLVNGSSCIGRAEYAEILLKMADLFLSRDAAKLLRGKKLCFIGDSSKQ
jgi:hypothetical protein